MTNPFLDLPPVVPYPDLDPAQVVPAFEELIRRADAALERVRTAPRPGTFASTVLAIDSATDGLDFAYGVLSHVESVCTSQAWREAYDAVRGPVSRFYAGIPLDVRLWDALTSFAAAPEAASLAGEDARLLSRILERFRRHGAALAPEDKARLADVEVELARLTTRFSQNVLDATNRGEVFLDDPAAVRGLPASAEEAASAEAAARGRPGSWRIPLEGPLYVAALTYLDDAGTRERLYRASDTRASEGEFSNREIVEEIVSLRHEKARLLGHADFADHVLGDRMAETGGTALVFLGRLARRVRPHAEADAASLAGFRASAEGPAAPPPAPWDVTYYAERQKKSLFDFDDEALKPYFPVDACLAGVFEISREVFGYDVRECGDLPVWHPDVRTYRLSGPDGRHACSLYVDLFPRDSKRGGAWMNPLAHGAPEGTSPDGSIVLSPHVGVICANFTRPSGGRPALLTYEEVKTLFHEFGHLLHLACSTVSHRSIGGTHVAWDFVELPSQLLENWAEDYEVIRRFAKHFETGEVLPEEMFARVRAARNFRSASAISRQVGLGTTDLLLHTAYARGDRARGGTVVEYARSVMQEYAAARLPEDHAFILGFRHLFGGSIAYAAGYYSYLWAEVLDADAFSLFQERGVFDRATGERFVRTILSRGDAEPPEVLFESFMGRGPDDEALLRRAGLAGAEDHPGGHPVNPAAAR